MNEKIKSFILKLKKYSSELLEDYKSFTPEEKFEAKENVKKLFLNYFCR